ncbi:MAG TPA: DNA polymerase III subunit delta' [Ktedonobacterales bacterium]|jgi:DNA polymerase-3 subunit delta'
MREVVGHEHARSLLEHAAITGQVSHAYLLTGPERIGKTTLALAFAALLQCTGRQPDDPAPCGACASCRKIAHANHPDVELVMPPPDKVWLPVERVREVVRAANLAPYEGRWRVFILPRAERMQAPTANALLKTLEEPPPHVVLLLTTDDPALLLPTLLSRCQLLPLHPLPTETVAAALGARWGVAPDEAAALAGLAGGRLGWAVEAHEKPALLERRAALQRDILALATATRDARMRQVAALTPDAEAARQALEEWTLWWRDVALAALGVSRLSATGPAREQAERMGRAVGAPAAETFLRRLVAARQLLEQNANPRLTLEMLALDMPLGQAPTRPAR